MCFYRSQLGLELEKYIEYFDGITFGIWECDKNQTMDSVLFKKQLRKYFELLKEKKIEGVVFCLNTVGDAGIETNRILKSYINERSDIEID